MRPKAFPEIELVLKEENEIRALAEHGLLNYLKTFELPCLIEFLEQIKLYNSRFSTQNFHPEPNGKTKVFSSEFHKNHWEILIKPSIWIALSQINSRNDEKIQALGNHWLPRIVRAFPTSEKLSEIIENEELAALKKMAEAAWHEIRRKKSFDAANRTVYEQIIFYLRLFINSTHFLNEKNRIMNDLLARLHVSSHSEDSHVDDVVHYVTSCLNHLNASQVLGKKINDAQTERFLKNPHYRGMTAVLYSKIIHQIETHGSKRQIESLHRLPVFNENSQSLPTRNFSSNNHVFAVPVFLLNHIPRFKPWPAWLFPNRSFRYRYFQNKHWILQLMKTDNPPSNSSKEIASINKQALEKMKSSLKALNEEAGQVEAEVRGARAKSTKVFLEQWRTCVHEFKNQIAEKVSRDSSILESLSIAISSASPNYSEKEDLKMNDSSINVRHFSAFNKKQKRILDDFFYISSKKDIQLFPIKSISRLLKNVRLSLLEMDDAFSHECRRYIVPNFFSVVGTFLINKSQLNWMLLKPDEIRIFVSCLYDYFSLSSEAMVKAFRIDFASQLRQIFIHQLHILCESIIYDYKLASLSPEKISDYHKYCRELLLITGKNPRLQSVVSELYKELSQITNPHVLEVKCMAILEGIFENRLSAPSKGASL